MIQTLINYWAFLQKQSNGELGSPWVHKLLAKRIDDQPFHLYRVTVQFSEIKVKKDKIWRTCLRIFVNIGKQIHSRAENLVELNLLKLRHYEKVTTLEKNLPLVLTKQLFLPQFYILEHFGTLILLFWPFGQSGQ